MSVEITIQMVDGGVISLLSETTDTIQSIKIKVQKRYGILQESQRLIYCGSELQDPNTLDDLNINAHCTLHLAIKLGWATPTTITYIKYIHVRTLTGSSMSIPFYKYDTILCIKKQICRRNGVPVSCQLLLFSGKHLSNNLTLLAYNIEPETLLHLILKPIKIFIKSQNNEIFPLPVHSTTTVLNMKEYMALTQQISTKQQTMSLYGKILHNNHTIKECKFQDFDVIDLNVNFEQLYRQMQTNVIQNMSNKITEKLHDDIKQLDDIWSDSKQKINEITSLCNMEKMTCTLLTDMQQYIIKSEKNVVNMQAFYKDIDVARKMMKDNHHKKMIIVSLLEYQYCDYDALENYPTYVTDVPKSFNTYVAYRERIRNVVGYVKDCRYKRNCYELILKDSLKSIDDEIKNVESLHQQKMEYMERLQEIIDKKITCFEGKYDEWNTNELVTWIKMIENKYFNAKEYETLLNVLNDMEIKGSELNEMNSTLFLNVIGLKDKKTKYILKKHINRIIQYKSDREHHNICGLCTKNIINTVLLPCGHCFYCYECSIKMPNIGNLNWQRCPICRRAVIQTVKTYMSGFTRVNK